MAQLIVYANANHQTRKQYPLLLDVQSNLLDDLGTRVVVPLAPHASHGSQAMTRLTPLLTVDDVNYLMLTPQLSGIPVRNLGAQVADLAHMRSEIIAALDFLISGF
ncbi:CcdB family protein [Ottowia testudinis]|uniref:Toxin CcdB n=1 Tax=Ottowia testudinis TaxID=2816950 RepID=A0A975H208_9BURK|nr:CcdB family protein [Ottowia testudinis]QTD43665.1 CcdB family protein [Ottowia testudinis]